MNNSYNGEDTEWKFTATATIMCHYHTLFLLIKIDLDIVVFLAKIGDEKTFCPQYFINCIYQTTSAFAFQTNFVENKQSHQIVLKLPFMFEVKWKFVMKLNLIIFSHVSTLHSRKTTCDKSVVDKRYPKEEE